MRYLTMALTGLVAAGLVLTTPSGTTAQPLDKAAIQKFMLTAEVVASEPIGTGVTNSWRLTAKCHLIKVTQVPPDQGHSSAT